MSMEFRNLIDKEELTIDSHRLAEYNDKKRLFRKIDKVRDDFVDRNVDVYGWEVVGLLCKLTEEIKSII